MAASKQQLVSINGALALAMYHQRNQRRKRKEEIKK